MTSVEAFNEMLSQFIGELELTFPDVKNVKKYRDKFEAARKANIRLPMNKFLEAIAPHAQAVTARDESFLVGPQGFLTVVGISGVWNECSDGTKDAIWQHIQSLLVLGQTISSLPADAMSAIESVAQKCADDLKAGPNEQIDMNSIFTVLQKNTGLLQNVFNGMVQKPDSIAGSRKGEGDMA